MPGLYVYRSNRVEVLASLLAELMRRTQPVDVFEASHVVVGSGGMAQWLRHRLADHLGICAHVVFDFPATAVNRITALALGEEPGLDVEDRWTPDGLTWALHELLPALVAQPGFEPLRDYLGPQDQAVQARDHALVRMLADVLDRVVTWREAEVLGWLEGSEDPAGAPPWLPALFREVAEVLLVDVQDLRALRQLRARTNPEETWSQPLRVFGVSSLPPSWVNLLAGVSRVVDVELFLMCPSEVWWAELRGRIDPSWLERGPEDPLLRQDELHPLLQSLGRVARAQQVLLESLPDQYLEAPGKEWSSSRDDFFVDPARDSSTALRLLQGDLLRARRPEEPHQVAPGDRTLSFHLCHGPTRQVEVLRDVLLHLLDDHRDLEPRDVVVMTPDIDTYAPLITAVFEAGREVPLSSGSWGPGGAPRLPYEIVDLSLRRTNPVAEALLSVLALAEGRMPASEVLDLLSLEPVRRRFGLDAEGLAQVRAWVVQSGIRWGVDQDHRAAEGQPKDRGNTWAFGLERLLLGVVMGEEGGLGEPEAGGDPVRPVDDVEGSAGKVLNGFVSFCAVLSGHLEGLQEPRTLAEWLKACEGVLQDLVRVPPSAGWLTRRVRQVLGALAEPAASCTRAVTLRALREDMAGRFEVPLVTDREQSGAITFCAMVPMRSIPARVVCLLGMDDGAFPRSPAVMGFDPTSASPRLTDRNARDEDRALLLEALLSARDHLVVLSTGRDLHSNEERAPAAPIGELRDVLDTTFSPIGGRRPSVAWTTEHALQAFSPRAFTAGGVDPSDPARPWSYDLRLLAGASVTGTWDRQVPPFFSGNPAPAAPDGRPVIHLDDLIAFLKAPTRTVLREGLGIVLRDEVGGVEDREPVELDNLENWNLRQALLKNLGETDLGARLRAEGSLPLGTNGTFLLEDLHEQVLELRAGADPWAGSLEAPHTPEPRLDLHLELDQAVLTGRLEDLFGDHQVTVDVSGQSPTRSLASWVRLQARQMAEPERLCEAVHITRDSQRGPQTQRLRTPGATPADRRKAAQTYLEGVVGLYLAARSGPLMLFEHASAAFARALGEAWTAEDFEEGMPPAVTPEQAEVIRQALGQAERAFENPGSDWSRGDLDDPAVAMAWREGCPFVEGHGPTRRVSPEFAAIALTVWQGLEAGQVKESTP